jgi:glycosyltransferase involved in cell wall biosynthesis
MAPREARTVKALLVVPRLPGTGFTGDRLRAELHLEALGEGGFDVTLLGGAPSGVPPPAAAGRARIFPVRLSRWRRPAAFLRAAVSGAPVQSGLFAGAWRTALAASGSADLVVVLLPQRLWPHLTGALPAAPLVVDYVDALGAAARQAAEEDPALWRRLYWRVEAARLETAERTAARAARLLLATTPFDAGRLPAGTVAVPNGVVIGPVPREERGPVVAFTGRLRYRPNRLAARRLVTEIWPLVRAAVPEARLALGGADAPAELARLHGRDGIEVTSPVPDMAAFLRRARAVAVPVALGTGTPNKLFEAFEAGCAVVASEEAAARAVSDGVPPPARIASSDRDLARGLVECLRDAGAAAADGARGRSWVEARADRRLAIAALRRGYGRALGEAA